MNEYRVVDAMAGLKDLSDASVDLIITDPPYDTLEKWRDMGTTTRLKESKASSNKWFPVVPPGFFELFFQECFRVLKKNTYLFVFCDDDTRYNIDPYIRGSGFMRRKALIWEKVGASDKVLCQKCGEVFEERRPGAPGMGYPFRSCYEVIYFAQKAKRKSPEDKTMRDVLKAPILKGNTFWPTEKPLELIQKLIAQSSVEGDLVLDPFAGSGSTLVAAYTMGRRFLGFDIQQDGQLYFRKRWEHMLGDLLYQIPKKPHDFDVIDLFS